MKRIYYKGQRRERSIVVPAALLAEALLDAANDDERRLGVHGADLVAAVVGLAAAQIHATPLHLAPRLLLRGVAAGDSGRGRTSFSLASARGGASGPPATARGGPAPAPAGHVLLEVDLLAELEPVSVVSGSSTIAATAAAAASLHCRRQPLPPFRPILQRLSQPVPILGRTLLRRLPTSVFPVPCRNGSTAAPGRHARTDLHRRRGAVDDLKRRMHELRRAGIRRLVPPPLRRGPAALAAAAMGAELGRGVGAPLEPGRRRAAWWCGGVEGDGIWIGQPRCSAVQAEG